MFRYQDIIVDEEDYEVLSPIKENGKLRKPEEYRTLEEAMSYTKEGELTLSAFPYLNGTVSMATLVENFMKEETLAEYTVKHIDTLTGDVTYRKYANVQRKISVDEGSALPKVLQVRVQQLDGNKANIKHPEFIHIGKHKYRLASGIEHMPGHYVAHYMTPEGKMVQANDSWVHLDQSSSFKGNGYYYVLDQE